MGNKCKNTQSFCCSSGVHLPVFLPAFLARQKTGFWRQIEQQWESKWDHQDSNVKQHHVEQSLETWHFLPREWTELLYSWHHTAQSIVQVEPQRRNWVQFSVRVSIIPHFFFSAIFIIRRKVFPQPCALFNVYLPISQIARVCVWIFSSPNYCKWNNKLSPKSTNLSFVSQKS